MAMVPIQKATPGWIGVPECAHPKCDNRSTMVVWWGEHKLRVCDEHEAILQHISKWMTVRPPEKIHVIRD